MAVKKHSGLGRGLGSLIPETHEQQNQEKDTVKSIDINLIKQRADQPRQRFDEEKIAELAQSIKQYGIIQPIIVVKQGKEYSIIAGERRYRAAKFLSLEEIPVIIKEIDAKGILEISLIENIQREDLNPIEEAITYKRLLSEIGLTQDELSKRIGRSRTAISNCMRLLNLDERVQNFIIEGVISEGHGRTLLAVDKEEQFKIVQQIIDEQLSVRETEKLIRAINTQNILDDQPKEPKVVSPYIKDVRNRLENYFGTKVSIADKTNKGKIEIEYYSPDDLNRILELINKEI